MKTNESKNYALHIGVNYVNPNIYGNECRLYCCENDATSLQQLTVEKGFNHTTLLVNAEANRENVIEALSNLAERMTPHDFLFLTYSGHGGSIPDENGDEVDGYDETWCLYNGHLIDDELHELFSQFKEGVRIFVVSDSCYSGTVTKEGLSSPEENTNASAIATHLRAREMPKEYGESVYEENKELYKGIQLRSAKRKNHQNKTADFTDIPPSILLLSGCQEEEKAYEGKEYGLLTGELLRLLKQENFQGNYTQLQETIRASLEHIQHPMLYLTGNKKHDFSKEKPINNPSLALTSNSLIQNKTTSNTPTVGRKPILANAKNKTIPTIAPKEKPLAHTQRKKKKVTPAKKSSLRITELDYFDAYQNINSKNITAITLDLIETISRKELDPKYDKIPLINELTRLSALNHIFEKDKDKDSLKETSNKVIKILDELNLYNIRVLLFEADTEGVGFPALAVGKEISDIQDALEKDKIFKVKHVRKGTLDNLKSQLIKFRPHILHFTGHSNQDAIFLAKDGHTKKQEELSNEAFVELLKIQGDSIRLLFWNSCKSVGIANAIKDLRPDIHQIYNIKKIGLHPASKFSIKFYKDLLQYKNIKKTMKSTTVQVTERLEKVNKENPNNSIRYYIYEPKEKIPFFKQLIQDLKSKF